MMTTALTRLALALMLMLLPAAAIAQGYDGLAARSLHIPGADGTRLAITVHQPTRAGALASERLPVIVTQNRGEIGERLLTEMRRFTDAGYVWVAQDRRGTGASFGRQTGFVNQADARDAKAVIEWAAAQPFSTGRVVGMGCSNQAAWQYLVATLRPRGLVAMVPACASPMFFDDAVAIGGIPMIALGDRPWAGECREGSTGARPGNAPPPAPRPVDGDDGTLLAAAQAEQRCGAPMLGQYWLNMARDAANPFADNQPALFDTAMTRWEMLRDAGIAVLQTGGWFDAAVPGQIEGQRVFGGRLIMGPWVHGNRPPPGVDFRAGMVDLAAETLRFFDLHAKGIGTPGPPILYYTINAAPGREWRRAEHWPALPRTSLYLGERGVLAPVAPARAGSRALPPGGARWFDGRYSALSRWFTGDFAASNAGSLLYESTPMAADTEITGTPFASLWISADQPDANVFAMLQDVAPDGRATYISDGRLRASWRAEHPLPWPGATRIWHRGYRADITPLVPGEPSLLRFDFFPVSYVVRRGHKLRLAITSAIGNAYDAPPLAGGSPITLTVHHGPDYPSAINLPMVAH